MSIENTLERIAVALEKLVEAKIHPLVINVPVAQPVNEGPAPIPATIATARPEDNTNSMISATEVKEEVVMDERDGIKAALTALGVPFNNKARTEVLAKLLEEQKAAIAEPVVAPVAAPVAPAISIDVVREAVKKYAAIKGKDKAINLLMQNVTKGKDVIVSNVPVEKYAEVIEFINKELEA